MRPPAVTMRIRCGCEGGGKGPLLQVEKSGTLATGNDQYLFAPQTVAACGETGGYVWAWKKPSFPCRKDGLSSRAICDFIVLRNRHPIRAFCSKFIAHNVLLTIVLAVHKIAFYYSPLFCRIRKAANVSWSEGPPSANSIFTPTPPTLCTAARPTVSPTSSERWAPSVPTFSCSTS